MPSMALPASTILYSTPKFQIKLCKYQLSQLQWGSLCGAHHPIYPKFRRKVIMAQMGEPNKVGLQLGIVKERLWETVPESVKDFPWKKAEAVVLQRMVFLGHKALKWSLVALFIFSFLPDAVFSISRNQELVIPFGLAVGCLMSDFLRDTLQEVFSRSEGVGLHQHLLSIGCFFGLVKFMSACFSLQTRIFLLHVANGGLMQVLWQWRNLVEKIDSGNGLNSISNPLARNAEY
ncbi:hypothetical protein Patl1_08767 [Pistacia atlantica]|uniref:Uncharacterized protein n=1 Tax=Pistacia atlantica TaxID=434234 RepID=A0ACC1AGT8_9ROSI|nr:hypothetical protein Patl1_08767 [Pistacia atlantica]